MATYDLFSGQSKLYAAFRPTYPADLYTFIFSHVRHRETAWDCATGNGQVARALAAEFSMVQATDISENQLNYAYRAPNIRYTRQPAEKTDFPAGVFDLITVAQALHWFRLADFNNEVRRVGKPGGIVAVWGYGNVITRPDIDRLVRNFYHNVVGEFWEPARKMVEEHYANIEFPFEEISSPAFSIEASWTLAHLLGYIESWSSTQGYIRKFQKNPMASLHEKLRRVCSDDEHLAIRFPVFMRMGRLPA